MPKQSGQRTMHTWLCADYRYLYVEIFFISDPQRHAKSGEWAAIPDMPMPCKRSYFCRNSNLQWVNYEPGLSRLYGLGMDILLSWTADLGWCSASDTHTLGTRLASDGHGHGYNTRRYIGVIAGGREHLMPNARNRLQLQAPTSHPIPFHPIRSDPNNR